MAVSHHEYNCGKSPGCFVWWISFHQNSNLQNLFGKICKSQSAMMIRRFDICIIAVTGMTAPDLEISRQFLRGHDIFSYLLVFLTFKERPVLNIANETFNLYNNIWGVAWIEHTNRISCAFVLSGDSSSYINLAYNLMLLLAASVN